MNKIICIIPARSGIKRIKNKNILKFFGIPFLVRTIKTAKSSQIFEKIIVSSNSKKILNLGKKYGAINYGLREKKFSGDKVTTDQLLIREIRRCNLSKFKFACCIYPATPLLDSATLNNAFRKFHKSNFDSLIGITKYDYPVLRALKTRNNKVKFVWPLYKNKRSQETPDLYHDCGYFYFFNIEKFIKTKKLISNNTGFFEIPRFKAIDIDDQIDLKIAKKLFKN